MKNKSLIKDYIDRADIRFEALNLIYQRKGYADVVREAQEIIELISKALVRSFGLEPARVHDVSAQLRELEHLLDPSKLEGLTELINTSKDLRRDRELAFYGTEDLTPSEFYTEKDAKKALDATDSAIKFVRGLIRVR